MAMLELQPHLLFITNVSQQHEDERTANLCDVLGTHLVMISAYAEAKPLLEQALDIRRQVLGPEHPDTASEFK